MEAEGKATEVKDKYDQVRREFDSKLAGGGAGSGSPGFNAGSLKDRAETLYKSTKDKLERLKGELYSQWTKQNR